MTKDWKITTEEVIQEVIIEKRLYERAVFLSENKDKSGKINTYSLCLWEKDYPDSSDQFTVPERNHVIVNIKAPASKSKPDHLKLSTMSCDVEMPDDMEYVDNASPYGILSQKSENLRDYFKRLIENAIDTYPGKSDSFGCCSNYKECSDARQCVHENLLYAKACSYRKNLEMGKIFYGKNKTI